MILVLIRCYLVRSHQRCGEGGLGIGRIGAKKIRKTGAKEMEGKMNNYIA